MALEKDPAGHGEQSASDDAAAPAARGPPAQARAVSQRTHACTPPTASPQLVQRVGVLVTLPTRQPVHACQW